MISDTLRKVLIDTLMDTGVFSDGYVNDLVDKIDTNFSKAKGKAPKKPSTAPKPSVQPEPLKESHLAHTANILSCNRVSSLAGVLNTEVNVGKSKSMSRASSILG